MSERELVKFDLTPDDIVDGLALCHAGVPLAASMAHKDLRVTNNHDGRFERVLALACAMMEKANPDMVAVLVDHDMNGDHVLACTVTVMRDNH